MKRTILGSTFALGLLAALSLAGCATGEPVDQTTAPCRSAEKSDILESVRKAGSFATLTRAIEAAGLSETLRGKGPFTVFAPTDQAFSRLPRGTLEKLFLPENREMLRSLLLRHVAAGMIDSNHIASLRAIPLLSGQPAAIDEKQGEVTLGGVTLFHVDIIASNGVIHMVGAVLAPEEQATNPQEPGIHPEEPVINPQEPVSPPHEPALTPQEPAKNPQEPAKNPQEPALTPQEPVSPPQEPALTPQEPVSPPQEPALTPQEPVSPPQEPALTPQEPVSPPQEPALTPQEPVSPPQEPALAPQEPVSPPQEPALAPQEPKSVPEEPAAPPEEKK